MRIRLAGMISRGMTGVDWLVVWDYMNKTIWITAGVLVIMGIVGCSGTSPRNDNRGLYNRQIGIAAGKIDYSAPSRTGTRPSPRLVRSGQLIPKGGGSYKIGRPYRIAGRLYVPRVDNRYNKTGKASWYGVDFHGRKTANGEIFDMNALTAAHPTLPLPSYAYVTNLHNNRTVLVRINDRGPYAHNRIIDLSRAVARALRFEQKGITDVRVRFAGRAPLSGDDRRETDYFRRQPWARQFIARNRGYNSHYSGLGGPRLPPLSAPQELPFKGSSWIE
ncbi:MAG: septal ring lytic transglycosylase RlpA family protein [Hyphomicrobiaceae bacterium]